MQTRRIITALCASIAVFYVWIFIYQRIWPQQIPPAASRPAATELGPGGRAETGWPTPSRLPGSTLPSQAGAATQPVLPATTSAPGAANELLVTGGMDQSQTVLGNAALDNPFPMSVEISPKGASVARAQLRGYFETVTKDRPYPLVEPVPLVDRPDDSSLLFNVASGFTDDLNNAILSPELRSEFERHSSPLSSKAEILVVEKNTRWLVRDNGQWYLLMRGKPSEGLKVSTPAFANSFITPAIRFVDLKQEVALDQVIWDKQQADDQHVAYEITIQKADRSPLARVTKTFTLVRQPAAKPARNQTYDLQLGIEVENLTDAALRVVLVQQGPLGFRQELPRGEDRKVIGANWQADKKEGPVVKGHLRSDVFKQNQLELGRDEEGRRIAWIAEANQYFACIMAPAGRQGLDDPIRFERAEATHLTDVPEPFSQDLTFRFITQAMDIAPGQHKEVGFDCYLGPKSKSIFDSVEKYRKRDYFAVISESFYFCAPAALVSLMMRLLNTFYAIPPHNYGIAIFVLVILVRAILHPITKKSQVNMTKMQKQMASLQPKIAAAKEKYGNDRAAMNQATMEVYKEAGINPASNILTCLPMMLQLPIWGALWTALSSTVEMRHAPFDNYWIKDLTQPDAVIAFTAIHIPLLSSLMGGALSSLNILPILLGLSQLLQTKFMPRGTAPAQPGGNPDQLEQQRKMMMFMSVFFTLMLYNAPSGLNLYIMSSNLFGILEQWRIRKHLADLDAKQKLAPPPSPDKPRSKSWLHRKWESLQKEADQARRIQSDRKKRPR